MEGDLVLKKIDNPSRLLTPRYYGSITQLHAEGLWWSSTAIRTNMKGRVYSALYEYKIMIINIKTLSISITVNAKPELSCIHQW